MTCADCGAATSMFSVTSERTKDRPVCDACVRNYLYSLMWKVSYLNKRKRRPSIKPKKKEKE